jgi:hypothetical protein
MVLGGLLLALGIVVATVDAAGTDSQASDLAQQVLLACAAGGDAARQLDELGACPQAVAVAAETDAPALIDPGLDTPQVVALIRDELADAVPGGQAPTAGELQAAVRAAAAADPAAFRGPAPSPEEVRAIAISVIAADPDAFRGEPGPAPAPAVDGREGDRGAQGPAGRGIVGSEEDPADPCVRIVRYDQPPLEERWRTCSASAPPDSNPDPEPDAAPQTATPPTATTPTPSPTPTQTAPTSLFGGLFR